MLDFFQSFISSLPSGSLEIGVIIIVAGFLAFFARLFKQPLIPAYIITGILMGPLLFNLIKNPELIKILSEIGLTFLIFTAGLEIKFNKLKELGKTVTIAGIFQIFLCFIIAFFISKSLGFTNNSLIYIGLIVAFSSTMVLVKLLSDKREINSLHGRIIVGILLIQDIAAIIALVLLGSSISLNIILISLLKIGIFVLVAFVLTKLINPIIKTSAKSPELLLLVAMSFLFLFYIGAILAKLSLVIGAFFAGVVLANSAYKTEIQGKIIPLRDFFAVIFFVTLGMQLKIIGISSLIFLLVLICIVIIIKPLIIMILIRILGYKKQTSFLTANALAQTSEFSLIIAAIGFNLGHLSQELFSVLILLTIFTISLTTYLIKYEKKLFKIFSWPLNLFNKFGSKKENLEYMENQENKTIIFGCHRMGSLLLKEFEEEKKDILVIDYNPEIIKSLLQKKVPCIYGDFMNPKVLEKANIEKTERIISTIGDTEDNLLLIKKIRKLNEKTLIFVVAKRISEAKKLYNAGADYVILPQVISGTYTFKLFEEVKKNRSKLKKLKKDHLKYLNSIHNILY